MKRIFIIRVRYMIFFLILLFLFTQAGCLVSHSHAAETIFDFNTGGSLTCTGNAPNISCTDSEGGMTDWYYYVFDWGGGEFNGSFLDRTYSGRYSLRWVQYDQTDGPDYGYFDIDKTKAAKGTTGSLKITVTGTETPGQYNYQIGSKQQALNYPSRIRTGTIGGGVYFDLQASGYHWSQLQNKDRLSMYVYFPKEFHGRKDSYNNWTYNLHLGTNACPSGDVPCVTRSGCDPYSAGEPCNGDSSHFYHHQTIGNWGGAGGWVHLLYDKHPQHERYNNWDGGNNPTMRTFGQDYFNSLSRIYFDTTDSRSGGWPIGVPIPFYVWIDEIQAQSTSADFAERTQNDDSISNVAVGYFPDNDGHWEISWNQGALSGVGTYQIKYSLTEFTNANYSSNGTTITPLNYACTGGNGLVGKLTRDDGYYLYSTSFTLPAQYTAPGTRVFFAIKDVSLNGSYYCADNGGNNTRTSTNPNIHTIDYIVAGGGDTVAPVPVQGLRIVQ